tara:strand:+ start:5500 stop:5697 length:198 start_codon:yes stop_codon:yes gene_type:complete
MRDFMGEINKQKIAAIVAIISIIDEHNKTQDIGRQKGEAWSQDHRRMNMGLQSLMKNRSSRSPWR